MTMRFGDQLASSRQQTQQKKAGFMEASLLDVFDVSNAYKR